MASRRAAGYWAAILKFHDGGGLCSPRRWPHDRRVLAEGDSWTWLRGRLATSRKKIVATIGDWITAQDLLVAQGQPLRLRLIRAVLQASDRDFLLQAEEGLW